MSFYKFQFATYNQSVYELSDGALICRKFNAKILYTIYTTSSYFVSDVDFVSYVSEWCKDEATLIGGCCFAIRVVLLPCEIFVKPRVFFS